ncbi:hypothetical protein COOONC_24718, partial [Cooperia oncophora]
LYKISEFGAGRSRLTGDPQFERVALKALESLWRTRSSLGLVGNHINVRTEYASAINRYVRKGDWFMWVTMTKGAVSLPVFQSLEAFWPGLLSMIGNVEEASRIMLQYSQVIRQYGFPPEFYNIQNSAAEKRAAFPLRPEIAESLMYLYRATEDPQFLEIAAQLV